VTSKSQNFLINSGGYTWRPFTTTATYNLAGGMTSETYPSGRTVNYEYDDAGRTTGFKGNLGDGTARNYATEMTYLPAGQLTKEALGKPSAGYQGMTTTLYQRLNYNTRQQLYAVRVGTYNGTTYDDNPQAAQSSQASSWDRGMLTWRYGSDDATTWGAGGANNNGNVLYAQHWIPGASSYNDAYEYDQLNRLTKVTESGNASFVQAFDYDRWGNRTII
jgi:YD repeat-containing protein